MGRQTSTTKGLVRRYSDHNSNPGGLLMRRTDFTMALFVATAFVLGGLTAVWVNTLGLDVDPSSSVQAFTAIL